MSDQPQTRLLRSILLVDCDAFFVQVARLDDPEGAGQAACLLVGGRGGRGVVTSASYEARGFGVRSGMPMAEALRLCPQALAVPVSRRACKARSQAIRRCLEQLAPVVQAASIDEFYLDMTGTERLLSGASLDETAQRIRSEVLKATDIHVSIGGGTNPLIAKLAAGRAKPRSGETTASGVWIVPPGEESAFMAGLQVRQIPGVGPALSGTLADHGIHTVPELLEVQIEWLARWVGSDRAHRLRQRALGQDDTPVTPHTPAKSISAEHTFEKDVSPGAEGDRFLDAELLRLAVSVGRNLRLAGKRARTIHLKLRDGDWTTHVRSQTLADPVESDAALLRIGRELLDQLRARGRPTRLLGLGVSGFVSPESGAGPSQQMELALPGLTPESSTPALKETERDRRLSRITDQLQNRFGDGVVQPARILDPKPRNPPHG